MIQERAKIERAGQENLRGYGRGGGVVVLCITLQLTGARTEGETLEAVTGGSNGTRAVELARAQGGAVGGFSSLPLAAATRSEPAECWRSICVSFPDCRTAVMRYCGEDEGRPELGTNTASQRKIPCVELPRTGGRGDQGRISARRWASHNTAAGWLSPSAALPGSLATGCPPAIALNRRQQLSRSARDPGTALAQEISAQDKKGAAVCNR